MAELSNCLREQLALIQDEKIMVLVMDFLNTSVPSYFFFMPASTSGRYHPRYALGEGGLVRHTRAAVYFAETLLGLEQNKKLNKESHDEIIAALILHDTYKQGLSVSGTKFEHPLMAAGALQIFARKKYPEMLDVTENIATLIASHMGQWNKSKKTNVVLPKPVTEAQQFVHMCDYLASRKEIFVDVEYEEEKIQ